jgi:hypothetical protein
MARKATAPMLRYISPSLKNPLGCCIRVRRNGGIGIRYARTPTALLPVGHEGPSSWTLETLVWTGGQIFCCGTWRGDYVPALPVAAISRPGLLQ